MSAHIQTTTCLAQSHRSVWFGCVGQTDLALRFPCVRLWAVLTVHRNYDRLENTLFCGQHTPISHIWSGILSLKGKQILSASLHNDYLSHYKIFYVLRERSLGWSKLMGGSVSLDIIMVAFTVGDLKRLTLVSFDFSAAVSLHTSTHFRYGHEFFMCIWLLNAIGRIFLIELKSH